MIDPGKLFRISAFERKVAEIIAYEEQQKRIITLRKKIEEWIKEKSPYAWAGIFLLSVISPDPVSKGVWVGAGTLALTEGLIYLDDKLRDKKCKELAEKLLKVPKEEVDISELIVKCLESNQLSYAKNKFLEASENMLLDSFFLAATEIIRQIEELKTT